MDQGFAAQLQTAQRLHEAGRLAEAEAAYAAVLRDAPGEAGALAGLAILALQSGRTERAVELFLQALGAGPNRPHLRNNLGIALRRLGRLDAALDAYDQAIALSPNYADAYNNRGNVLLDLQRPAEALDSFDRALALRPGEADWRSNRGLALLALDRPEAALESFDVAVALVPDFAPGHFGRGLALAQSERTEEALAAFDAAISLRPAYATALNNRGVALARLRRLEAALESFDAALTVNPAHPETLRNRGDALRRLGRLDEALGDFDTAIAADPDLSDARFRRALVLLAQGRFAEGWRDYEHRWRVPAVLKDSPGQTTADLRAAMAVNLRPGDLSGRRVLLMGEQGVGDVLMFASLLPEVLAEARSVALLCETRLHRLLSASFPSLALFDRSTGEPPLSDYDLVAPIGGLAVIYRNRQDDFPGRPFLTAGPTALARWADALGQRAAPLRIGISWKGGLGSTGAAQRSLALADLRPILEPPGCEAVCLQYGDNRAEVEAVNATLPRPIRLFEPEAIADFEDLAALVRNLDVVVSVQTAVVHLAGALGVPALVMIPAVAEWRYGAAGETMPWYASLELFRQGADAAWAPVVERVAARLRDGAIGRPD